MKKSGKQARLRITTAILIFLLLMLCAICVYTDVFSGKAPDKKEEAVLPEGSYFKIHFIDVGQGDCTLIECDGEFMLIDGGDSKKSSTVAAYLKKCGADELKYLVATHPHDDHIGGLSGALNVCRVETVFSTVTEYPSKPFSSFLKYTEKQGLVLTKPELSAEHTLGNASFTFLAPVKSYPADVDVNNTSLVTKITYGNNSFVVMGDAEILAENDMLDSGADISCDVLRIGHHGSASSTSMRLLFAASPKYAVISVGKDNEYGHPSEDVMDKLSYFGIPCFRTDEVSDIVFSSDGNSVTVETTGKNKN